jgi:hypothetical protein
MGIEMTRQGKSAAILIKSFGFSTCELAKCGGIETAKQYDARLFRPLIK